MTKTNRTKERGMALLLAIVALLLITAAGLALMFSSDTETAISVNYRDKQVAIYAALGGLQEGRERIHATNGDLGAKHLNLAPTALPSASAKNVLYIINPGPGETVNTIAPWAPTIGGKPNPYFDTELCQEHVLGMTGTPGVPCDPTNSAQVPPSGNSWYNYVDNSNPPSGADTQWSTSSGSPVPLRYKWVRVVLKADNMTPAIVGSGNGSQVCWNPPHQEQIKPGYSSNCNPPKGKITNIAITNHGSGYTSAPTVELQGGGGSGATATAQIGDLPPGSVTSVSLASGGSGYSSSAPPVVNVVSQDGNGCCAQVLATVGVGVPLKSVTMNSPSGTVPCYPADASLTASFDATAGTGATGTVQVTGQRCIYSFTSSGSCGNKQTLSVTATNGSGSGFSGTVVTSNKGNNVNTVNNPGDYSTVPTKFTSSSCSNLVVTPTYGVQISGVTIANGGLYNSAPNVTFAGANPATGSGTVTGTGVLDGAPGSGPVTALTIANGGTGYTVTPKLVIAAPSSGTTATGTASITPTKGVTAITWSGGSNYTSAPVVKISGGGGSGAAALASVGAGDTYAGRVYLVTAMALTASGSRAMAQMELGETYQKSGFNLQIGGALSLLGPKPVFGTPNSNPFIMNGNDANSCSETQYPAKPAIGVYDDPNNPTTPSSVKTVLDALGKPNNYIGKNSAPDIENVFASMGNPTPGGLNSFVQAVAAVADHTYGSNPSSIALGSATNPAINVVNGDFSMGPQSGYGVLVVTGTLTFSGNYDWHGLILVIGEGASIMNGGGNGKITGAVLLANTSAGGTTLGSPNANWSGGGGNGIQYDHCWADNMLAKIPFTPQLTPDSLSVISLRFLDM